MDYIDKLIRETNFEWYFIIVAYIFVGFYVYAQITNDELGNKLVEKSIENKPILDTRIEESIARDQATTLSKGEMKARVIDGDDGVKRTIIPYESPDGRKGYTVIYEKTEILTDENGSTTEKVYRQQIDYGHEGRTQLW